MPYLSKLVSLTLQFVLINKLINIHNMWEGEFCQYSMLHQYMYDV